MNKARRKIKKLLGVLIIGCFGFIACSSEPKKKIENYSSEEIQNDKFEYKNINQNEKASKIQVNNSGTEYGEFSVADFKDIGYIFTVTERGDIITVSDDGILQRITPSGDVIEICKDANDLVSVCSVKNEVIAYDMGQGNIRCFDLESKAESILAEDFYAQEVLNMQVGGDCLYVLIVPLGYQGYALKNDYINFEETMYCFSLEDGKKEKLEIQNCMDFAVTRENKIVYYAYETDTYVLNKYDPATKEIETLYDMMQKYHTKYASAITFTGDMFAYAEMDTPAVHLISLSDGTELYTIEQQLVVRGGDLITKSDMLFCKSYKESGESSFYHLRLNEIK